MTPARENELREKIIAHLRKTSRCPDYKTVGSDYFEANPVFAAMFADGTLVRVDRLSPKGRRMSVVQLGGGR